MGNDEGGSATMLLPFGDFEPRLEMPCFVAPGAHLIGRVEVRTEASVWFNAVLRGDEAAIVVGEGSNVQDGVVIHTDPGHVCTIGTDVTIGHNAVIHGAAIGNRVLVGMGAVILTGAEVGDGSLVAAGSLVTERQRIPPGSVAMGAPARVVRRLTAEEQEQIAWSAAHYRELWHKGGWG